MTNLLLELLSEEIPAKMQENACNTLAKKIRLNLEKYFDKDFKEKVWVTPRRIGIYFEDLVPAQHNDASKEIKGPKTNAPEIVISGFLKKYNVSSNELITKGDYFFLNLKEEKKDALSFIKEILEHELKTFVWPKSMKWGMHTEISWIRPLKSILCLYDNKVLPIKFGHITASNTTVGHRFYSSDNIEIKDWEDYQRQLKATGVILNADERKDIILQGINKITTRLNLTLIQDEELLNEIVGLVEFPVVYLGKIDSEFMDLPKEVLIITLKHHQRYLMLEDRKGNIAPYFIIVSNIEAEDGGREIINGNARVLKARLTDAAFFLNNDKKETLISRSEKLKTLTFHQQLGSIYHKKESVKSICEKIANLLSLDDSKIKLACDLAKVDLTTSMVKEFPELQGIVGYYYALYDNVDADVAIAIKDQYKPRGPSDGLPTNIIGKVLALGDKLDTLNQMFSINIKPTGSKDPYALRRAAIGIIRIILSDPKLRKLSLSSLVKGEVKDFILERAKIMHESQLIDSNEAILLKGIF